MRILPRAAAVVVGGAVTSVLSVVSLGRARWNHETARAARLIGRGPGHAPRGRISPEELVSLPDPVARYLRFALAADQPRIRSARVTHRGQFQATPGKWNDFTSVEYLSTDPPGFVWDASIHMAPLLSVLVRDSYLKGVAAMHASADAVWTVTDQHGSAELSQSALQRWLGEAAWVPTALLPTAGVRWDPIDGRSARATITDHGITASLVFEFGARGPIVRCSGDRYRDLDGAAVLTPWEGTCEAYARVDGMMIPTCGEAAWLDVGGRIPYWRGRITGVNYDAE